MVTLSHAWNKLFPALWPMCVCAFFLLTFGHSQTDTTRIINYTDKIILKANVDTRSDVILYKNREDGSRLHLLPNNRYRLFLSLDYEFIGVSIGVVPKFLGANSDEDLKGTSSFTDYRFRFFLGKWVQSLTYSNVKGYYVRNTRDFVPDWTKGTNPYLQFEGLGNTLYGMSTSYVFNPDFSYRNIVYQNEWQRKSSGSLVASLYYDYTLFRLKEESVDAVEKFFNVRLAPSYYYTFVLHDNWFLSGNISPSLGIKTSRYEIRTDTPPEVEKNTYFTKNLAGGINLGFSSEKVIFGINLNFSADWYNEDDASNVETDQFYGLLYFGYRFEPPKGIKKLFHSKD
ncbi:DUF4421 family protein [Flagellimonas aequoris]|uniref:DUF4421 domain-containing protein n=1 Tax=Flagellimonas aequoris TaxID=2306997 RepID=A0A418N3Y5_9FLAO|nr:DUF4421 family protein [Allomuricauda aequoris]RIV68548.1 DUF4421 domain-containing protein [Allomuricauda aequoris]TXK00243.1 DUF4421 domain-containing protein [Allomuricauda aequoris]